MLESLRLSKPGNLRINSDVKGIPHFSIARLAANLQRLINLDRYERGWIYAHIERRNRQSIEAVGSIDACGKG